jgi:hypothetical protein
MPRARFRTRLRLERANHPHPERLEKTMLYKFKSNAGGDVIMLEATGRQVLGIMGKGFDAKGILLPDQMPSAKAAIETAVAQEEKAQQQADADEEKAAASAISLRTRAWPLVTLIERSLKANVPITWGV